MATGARAWVVGFAVTTIIAVCCSLPTIVRNSIREEQAASSLVLQHEWGEVAGKSAVLCTANDLACSTLVNASDSFCALHSGGFRGGRCASDGEGKSMTVSSMLLLRGLFCVCRREFWDRPGRVVLESVPKAPDAFQGDETKRFEFARGVAIVGMALASFCSLLRIRGVLGWIRAMAVGGGISSWRREFSRACTWLKATFVQKADLRSNRIRELVTKKRLRRARALLWGVYPICCLIVISECRQFWLHETPYQFLYDSAVVPSMYLLMFTLLHQLKIQEISPMWLDGLNVSLSAMWVCKYLVLGYWTGARDNIMGWLADVAAQNARGYTGLTGWMQFGRLLQGLLCGNAKLSVLLNVIVTVVDMHAHGVADPPFFLLYIHQQAAVCGAMSLIFCWDAQQLLAEAAALMDAETSNSKYSLAHRVLEATCDAVAYLDTDLSLLGPCPKLAQMLLRHPKAAHEGSSFVDFLSQDDNDDVDRVQHLMQQEVKASLSDPAKLEPAGTVHVHMVDADQNKVPVQLYWCCAAQMDGQVQHLVGISQHAELAEQDAETSNGQRGVDTHLGSVREGTTVSFARRLERDRIAVSATSSQPSVSSAESAYEDISVCIDAASRTLTFLWCSNAFLLLCGFHGPGIGLGGWLQGKRTGKFTSWLSSSNSGPDFDKVDLQPPGLTGVVYRTNCRRRAAPTERLPACAEDTPIAAVELIFNSVRLRSPEKKSCHRQQLQAPRITSAPTSRCSNASVDVGLPSGTILAVDFFFGMFSGDLLSTLKVGSSMKECLVDHRAFMARLAASTREMPHGKQQDAAALDLGVWNLRTLDSQPLPLRVTLAGIKAPSKEAEPDSTVCQLEVEVLRGASPVMVVTACSLEVRTLLGFDPLGQKFLPWFSRPSEFSSWVGELHVFGPGDDTPQAALEFGEITLRPGDLVEHAWEIRAVCRCVILPRELDNFAESDMDLLTVELRAAQKVHMRSSL